MANNAGNAPARQFPRLSRQGRIEYRVIGAAGDEQLPEGLPEDLVRNISGGGIRFDSHEPVRPGSHVAIRIDLPSLSDSVFAVGRVVSCEPPTKGDSRSELAVEFFWTGWGEGSAQQSIHEFVASTVGIADKEVAVPERAQRPIEASPPT